MSRLNVSFTVTAILGSLTILLCAAGAQVATTSEQAEKTLTIRNVTLTESRLAGEITNHSTDRAGDISLMVQNSWRWKDGFVPEIEAPLNAVLFKLQKELLPGETAAFTYVVSLPPGDRNDGQFVTDVSVASFKLLPSEHAERFSSIR